MRVGTERCGECVDGWQGEDVCPVCDGDAVTPVIPDPFGVRESWCRTCGHTVDVAGHCPNHKPQKATP